MELKELFEMQRRLDEHIIRKKGLEGQDLLPNKILALQVELGELANEWQGFKHWKVNPKPKDGMLEEFVDCLHFFLSIGLDLEMTDRIKTINDLKMVKEVRNNIEQIFIRVIHHVGMIDITKHFVEKETNYIIAFNGFLILGERLGFTWEQITQAYKDKNKINHERQENGY